MLKIKQLRKAIHQAGKKASIRRPRMLMRQGQLVVAAQSKSKSTGEVYELRLAFDVRVSSDKDDLEAPKKFKRPNGKVAYYDMSDFEDMDVIKAKVRCTCNEFKFTYAQWNDNKGALYGSMFKLPKPKGVRPPRNPKQRPGMCKHLLALVDYVEENL